MNHKNFRWLEVSNCSCSNNKERKGEYHCSRRGSLRQAVQCGGESSLAATPGSNIGSEVVPGDLQTV